MVGLNTGCTESVNNTINKLHYITRLLNDYWNSNDEARILFIGRSLSSYMGSVLAGIKTINQSEPNGKMADAPWRVDLFVKRLCWCNSEATDFQDGLLAAISAVQWALNICQKGSNHSDCQLFKQQHQVMTANTTPLVLNVSSQLLIEWWLIELCQNLWEVFLTRFVLSIHDAVVVKPHKAKEWLSSGDLPTP